MYRKGCGLCQGLINKQDDTTTCKNPHCRNRFVVHLDCVKNLTQGTPSREVHLRCSSCGCYLVYAIVSFDRTMISSVLPDLGTPRLDILQLPKVVDVWPVLIEEEVTLQDPPIREQQ